MSHGNPRSASSKSAVAVLRLFAEFAAIILANREKLSGHRPVYRMIDDSELALTIQAAG
ncbi:MAG TPA: hypothetical protein PLP08_13765 [Plasticicumulans sp.]|uniref:hypothetical protein n=1 Tax=Plasticicumulans sp. TaxID=2307179 RepID=UPI002BE28CFD|nr:hypothetical protein [Plasticicumulans sp.]HMW43760.1 hypothetical protein [Plasticicumulans sp.]HNF66712.1 hypothetical protein [Plasticicumulans sp.]HNG50655.1 hypothetical protein [Plasticicumulans sp.]HNJ08902.1 hypothetical protein [Plasticicumulans sp.]HNM43947.1 hypothetical protein [Plasticicumulans sp.]